MRNEKSTKDYAVAPMYMGGQKEARVGSFERMSLLKIV